MSNHQKVLRFYVKFDDLTAGMKASSHDNLGRIGGYQLNKTRQHSL